MGMGFDASALAQLRALAETTGDVFVTIDEDSYVRFANPAVETVLGHTPEELVGRPLTDLMSEAQARRHLRAVDRYLETGRRRLDWAHVEFPGRHKDGHEVPLEIAFSEFTVDGDRFFAGVLRDVTERKTLEAERDLLHAVRETVVGAASFSAGLTDALGLLGESMDWVYGEAWVPTDGADSLERAATWTGDASDADLAAFRATAETIDDPGTGLVGRVRETGEHEWVSDVSADAAFQRRGAAAADLGAALGVPIRADDGVVAVLVFLLEAERAADERLVETTRSVAADLGPLLARKRAEEALRDEHALVSNVLDASPTGIAVVDADGEFRYANDRAAELLRLETPAEATPAFEDLPVRFLGEDGDPLPGSELPFRYVLRTGEDVTRDIQIEYPDGTRRRLSVDGAPLRSEGGADGDPAVVFALQRAPEREVPTDRLRRLQELGRALSAAETVEAVGELAAAAARDVLGLPVATIDRYDPDAGRLDPCARTDAARELVGDGPLFAPAHGLPWQVFAESDARVYPDLDRESAVDADETPLASAILLPLDGHGVLVAGATAPDALSETTVALAELLAQAVVSAFDRLDREASLRSRAAELEAANEQLRRVQRVNQQIRDVVRALLAAESRAEIEQFVCDALADREPYCFVWFGERESLTGEITPAAWAGDEQGYLDAVTATADGDEDGGAHEPASGAIRTGEAQVQNNLQSDPPFEPWRREALQRGYRASASVPVAHRDTLYGLLTLYADEPGAFTETDRVVLTELGDLIGYALTAMERYEALVSEESIELAFAIRDDSDPLLGLLRAHGGRFRLENVGGREGNRVRLFGTFENVCFDAVQAFVDSSEDIEGVTLIRERNEEVVVELALAGDAFVAGLLDRGAVPTVIEATPEESRMTIRIAKSATVREFVERFRRRYEDVELVTRREVPAPIQTREAFERTYLDGLTERQQQVLRTAYFAGFFEQPRESTARDVADILGVSQPTVSRHIRAAEQTLFERLFGETPE
jgi:PAS domain S-box-containing protein